MRYLNVEKVEKVSDSIYELFLVRDDLEYKVGNCVSIYGPDGQSTRPYSFSSSPNDKFISFLIKRFPDGYVSTYLTSLKQGDRIKISNPFGWFNPGSMPNSVFLATGTGISPFISAIRNKINYPKKFYYGCRTINDIISLIDIIPDLKISLSKVDPMISSISNALNNLEEHASRLGNKLATYAPERITQRFKVELENWPESFKDCHFYLCGLDSMIVDCIDILTKNGVELDRIHHETFFNSQQ